MHRLLQLAEERLQADRARLGRSDWGSKRLPDDWLNDVPACDWRSDRHRRSTWCAAGFLLATREDDNKTCTTLRKLRRMNNDLLTVIDWT